jgi:hypothetical protein
VPILLQSLPAPIILFHPFSSSLNLKYDATSLLFFLSNQIINIQANEIVSFVSFCSTLT